MNPSTEMNSAITRVLVQTVVDFCNRGDFESKWFSEFRGELRNWDVPQSDAFCRSAFLEGLSKFSIDTVDSLPDSARIARDFKSTHVYATLCQMAGIKAILSTEPVCSTLSLDRPVTYDQFFKTLQRLKVFFWYGQLEFSLEAGYTRSERVVMLTSNLIYRCHSMSLYNWIRYAISSKNVHRDECEFTLASNEHAVKFREWELNGPFDLGLGIPVREYGAMKHQARIGQFLGMDSSDSGPSRNQMMAGLRTTVSNLNDALAKTPEIVNGVKETVETSKVVVNKVDAIVDELSSSVKQNSESIRQTTEAVQQALPFFERLEQLLSPVFSTISNISSAMAKVAEAMKRLFKFAVKFAYVSFPLVFCVLVVILKPWIPQAIAKTIIVVAGLVGTFVLGLAVSGAWARIMQCLEDYWSDRGFVDENKDRFVTTTDNEEFDFAKVQDHLVFERDMGIDHYGPDNTHPYETPFKNQMTSDVITLLASVYCGLGVDIKKKPEVISALKAIPSVSKGAEALITSITNFFATIMQSCAAYFGLEFEFAAALDDQYHRWMMRTNEFLTKDKSFTLDVSEKGFADLQQHVLNGVNLASSFEEAGQKTLGNLLSKHVYALQGMLSKLDAMRITEPKDRVEPLSVLFKGDPGHGKTTAVGLLADALARYELRGHPTLLDQYERTPRQFIHQKGTEKWYEGYNPQTLIMIHNEFPITKETSAEDSLQVGFIDEIDSSAKPLPMANAEMKGKMYYNHKYSLLTTNAANMASNVLICNGALARRLHLVIQVETIGNVANHRAGEPVDPDRWRFTLMRKTHTDITYEATGVDMNLKMLLALIVGIKEMRENLHRVNLRTTSGIVDDLLVNPQANLVSEASGIFKESHGRMPDHEELITFIFEQRKFFEDLGFDLEPFDRKQKQKVPEDLSRAASPTESDLDLSRAASPTESDLDASLVLPNRPQADSEYVDLMGFPINDLSGLYKCIVDRDITTQKRAFLQCLGWQIEGRLVTFNKPQVRDGASNRISVNLITEADFTSQTKYLTWGVSILSNLMSNYKGHGLYQELETMLGLMVSFGKYQMFGYRIPMLEPFISGKYTGINGAQDDAAAVALDVTERGRPYSLASLLASFMAKIGMSHVFGLSNRVVADWYVNEWSMIDYATRAGRTFVASNYAVMRAFMSSVLELYRKYNRGEVTLLEAAKTAARLVKIKLTESWETTRDNLISYYNDVTNKLRSVARDAWFWLRRYGTHLVASLAGLIAASVFLFNMPGGSLLNSAFNQDSSSRTDKYINARRATRAKARWSKSSTNGQNQESRHWMDNVVPVVQKNTYSVITPSGKFAGTILFVERKRAIFLWHYFETAVDWVYPDGAVFRLQKGDKTYSIMEEHIHFVKNFNEQMNDGCLVDVLHPDLPLHKNISKHFVDPRETDMEMLKGTFKIAFVNTRMIYVEDAVMLSLGSGIEEADAKIVAEVTIAGSPEPRINCIGYMIPTQDGDCGSVVFYKGKICGIHAHGNGRSGQATRWNKLMLQEAYKSPIDEGAEKASEFEPFDVDFTGVYHNEAYDDSVRSPVKIGIASPPMNTFVKKWYVPWNEEGPLKSSKLPCNPVISNYPAARSKYGYFETKFDTEVMDFCALVYGDHILKRPNPEPIKRLLTASESIQGIADTSIGPLDQTTSPGFPFNYYHRPRTDVYKITPEGKLVKGPKWDEFFASASLSVKMMSTGIVPIYVFTDAMKYELRKPDKVDKPRLISGAPFEHTCLSRVFFGGFAAHVSDTWMFGDTLMGVDPHHDADFLERRFLSVGGGVRECTGDFSGWDGNCPAEIIEILVKIVNRFYGDEESSGPARVRHGLGTLSYRRPFVRQIRRSLAGWMGLGSLSYSIVQLHAQYTDEHLFLCYFSQEYG